jgi:hypothetical protein
MIRFVGRVVNGMGEVWWYPPKSCRIQLGIEVGPI